MEASPLFIASMDADCLFYSAHLCDIPFVSTWAMTGKLAEVEFFI